MLSTVCLFRTVMALYYETIQTINTIPHLKLQIVLFNKQKIHVDTFNLKLWKCGRMEVVITLQKKQRKVFAFSGNFLRVSLHDYRWRVLKQCKPYSSISNKCNLCLFEKYVIICKKNLCSLNKRNELASSCQHRTRYLLQNFVVK